MVDREHFLYYSKNRDRYRMIMAKRKFQEEYKMTLAEVRKQIDSIDPQIKELLMQRMDCSYEVARAKAAAGETTIYRADREEAILKRLGEDVPEERRAGYLAVVRKIMETSRMYQYSLLYDWMDDLFAPLAKGLEIKENGTRVRARLTRENRPNAMSSILSMIGDYGYNMDRMELLEDNKEAGTVTFELAILGNLSEKHMKTLMFQLSKESMDFQLLETTGD